MRNPLAAVLFLGLAAGSFNDANDKSHGFVRLVDGTVSVVDVPGARGTVALARDNRGEIYGRYLDTENVYHGFVLKRSGKVHRFDVPGALRSGTATTVVSADGTAVGEYDDATGVGGFIRRR